MNIFLSLLISICTIFPRELSISNIEVADLKVEYSQTPLGIDVEAPRFSWKMVDDQNKRGRKQTAYRIVVFEETGEVTWDSNKTSGSKSLNITYMGEQLKPRTRYNWKVTVWDEEGKEHFSESWFETGLQSTSINEWNGAKWIGAENDMVLYPDYLPVFKFSYNFKTSNKATFIYGANDPRLMDKNKNLHQLENEKNESYIAIEFDVKPLEFNETAKISIYRVGYDQDDRKDVPFKTFDIPKKFINEANRFEEHTLSVSSNLGITQIYFGAFRAEYKIAEFNINPLGAGGDFIAFPVLGSIGFQVPKDDTVYFSNLLISHFRSPSNLLYSDELEDEVYNGIFKENSSLKIIDGAYVVSSGNSGELIIAKPETTSMPMLRTTFTVGKPIIKKARLYASARGIYDIYMNGKRVNSTYFNPGSTQYNKTQMYQTFDVTKHLKNGLNGLGVTLGEGWWSGAATFSGENWNFFGDRQSFLGKLVITYEDGKEDVIITDSENWEYYSQGPLLYGSFFQGEVFDAQKTEAIENWSSSDYKASGWKKATITELSNSTSPVWENEGYSLLSQFEEPVRKLKEMQSIAIEEIRPGVYIYDMGQNMVGVPEINLPKMESGRTITLRYSEVKYPNLPEYEGLSGMLMLENIRAAMAQDIYITSGKEDKIAPRFTFHGFRYIEITGIDKALPLEDVKASVLSSINGLNSHYETSNELVNKLWENITWSTFGNFLSIPTDCPQRNERLGWSGDISVFARTATYLSNIPQFLRKHLLAMRDLQDEAGRFPDVAPTGYGFGGLLWGSAGITVAWESYQQYEDLRMLTEHYDAMKSYIEFVRNNYIDPQSNLIVQTRAWSDLGDWLGPEQEKNDNSLLWEAYYLYDLHLMVKISGILNKPEDTGYFQNLYNKRFNLFNSTYIDTESKKTIHSSYTGKTGSLIDTQISYVLPLAFDILEPQFKDVFIENLVRSIQIKRISDDGKSAPPYSLMTGFIGTAWINSTLSDFGQSEAAYRLLQQTSYPSWLYSVTQGATTIWERLNSYTKEDGFGGNNRMNSFNHYSFGAVGAWMYTHSLGIQRDEQSPGFNHFILQPEPDPTGQMTFAKGFYDSMYGKITSSWESSESGVRYNFTVPANTSATLLLNGQVDHINFEEQTGVIWTGSRNGKQVYEITSGTYQIQVKN